IMAFEWIPGRGMDSAAIERMKAHFSKPTKPSYEAWFISGEINYWWFDANESSRDLAHYLFDNGGGIMNFGRREEWVIWFQYLLPYLLPRFDEENLLALMMNYAFNLYPDGLIEEYPGFRDDILATLGQAIMSPELWQDGEITKSPRWYNESFGFD